MKGMLRVQPSILQVATGGAAHQPMPMLLLAPQLFTTGWGILGYGDVLLPGLLVVYARIFDLDARQPLQEGYWLPVVGGYGLGLVLTYIGLYLRVGGSSGQPALL